MKQLVVVGMFLVGAVHAFASQQPGAGAVQDLVGDLMNGRVLIATSPGGMQVYDVSGGPSVVPVKTAEASIGYAGRRIAMSGLTVAVTIDQGGGISTYEAGHNLEELGHIPGKFQAVGVASNEERVLAIDTSWGNPATVWLRTYHRNGGGCIAKPPPATGCLETSLGNVPIGGMAVCGGTAGDPTGSRVYVTTGTGRTLRVFDGVSLGELRPPISLAEDGLRIVCDGLRIWVSTPTQSVQHDGTTLLPTGRTAPVVGRSGFDLRGPHMYGVQYDVVRSYDVTSSVSLPPLNMRSLTGVAACGGWGVVCFGSAASGIYASQAGLHVRSLGGAVTPAATSARTGTAQPTVAPATSTRISTAQAASTPTRTPAAAPTCAPGCVVGQCGG